MLASPVRAYSISVQFMRQILCYTKLKWLGHKQVAAGASKGPVELETSLQFTKLQLKVSRPNTRGEVQRQESTVPGVGPVELRTTEQLMTHSFVEPSKAKFVGQAH